jgi:CBS-domain-containing membrane protein
MRVADIMVREVTTVGPEMLIEDLCEVFQLHNIHGVPVVDDEGRLVGIVTQEDVIYGTMGLGHPSREERNIPALVRGAASRVHGPARVQSVGDIMTSPAISVEEGASVEEVCRLMWTLKIHRVPVVRGGRVTGIVSSLDVVRAAGGGAVDKNAPSG